MFKKNLLKILKTLRFHKGTSDQGDRRCPNNSQTKDPKRVYSKKEEEEVRKRLRDLNYLD